MATSFSVMTTRSDILREEYQKELDDLDLAGLVREFFSYLDYTEESDSGRVFNPITIGSCRVLMSQPLGMCLEMLREKVKDG